MNKQSDLWQCIGLLVMFVLILGIIIGTTPHTTVKAGWVITNDKTLHEQTLTVTKKYISYHFSEVWIDSTDYMVEYDNHQTIECEHKWIWEQLSVGKNTVWISNGRWNKPELIQAIKTPAIKGVQKL